MNHIVEVEESINQGMIPIRSHSGDQWKITYVLDRPIHTVFVPVSIKWQLMDSISKSLDPKRIRAAREAGAPLRRGFLLSSPAGYRKTSLIIAICSAFNLPIFQIFTTSLKSDTLGLLMGDLPSCFALLIDDFDEESLEAAEGLKLNELLSRLDGALARPSCVLFFLTNLPPETIRQRYPSLVRPGRVDECITLPLIDKEMTEAMFNLVFCCDDEGREGAEFANKAYQATSSAIWSYLWSKNTKQDAIDGVGNLAGSLAQMLGNITTNHKRGSGKGYNPRPKPVEEDTDTSDDLRYRPRRRHTNKST
jgi:hypothetical protein